jgi:RNA polymerase-binding transcription factor DksA
MNDTSAYKIQLEEELEKLTSDLKELGIHNPQVKEDWIALPQDVAEQDADENVVADKAEDWLERSATLGQLETRYNTITKALEKIENGTFGICEIGGEEIEHDRLSANPAARTCKAHMNDEQSLPA